MQPSAKRHKGENGKAEKKVTEVRKPAKMGIMLMTLPDEPFGIDVFSMDEDKHSDLELAIQTRLEQHSLGVGTKVFGALPVRVRLLRYATAGTRITEGNEYTFVPFAKMDQSTPLRLICNFIADWVTNGAAVPFQKRKTFPVADSDEDKVDHGPFHAMVFSRMCSALDWKSFESVPYSATSIRWEAATRARPTVLDGGRRIPNHAKWVANNRPVFPVLSEILHTLAGQEQDMKTWFAYDLLVSVRDMFEAALEEKFDGGFYLNRYFESRAWMPMDLLQAPLRDGSTPFMFFRLVQGSVAYWIGIGARYLPGVGPDRSWKVPQGAAGRTPDDFRAKVQLLTRFIDGTVQEADFKEDVGELLNLLLGQIPQDELLHVGSVFFDADETYIPYWTEVCMTTLRRHMLVKHADLPRVDKEGSGTLTEAGQVLAWERLSIPARWLIENNPALVLHAVIMIEDPNKVSPKSVLQDDRKAWLYRYLQGRVLYYTGFEANGTDEFRRCLVNTVDRDKAFVRGLYELHPELRVRPVESLIFLLRKDRQAPMKPTGPVDPRGVMEIRDVARLMSTFGKYKARAAIFKH